jgi:hypothetical protein
MTHRNDHPILIRIPDASNDLRSYNMETLPPCRPQLPTHSTKTPSASAAAPVACKTTAAVTRRACGTATLRPRHRAARAYILAAAGADQS